MGRFQINQKLWPMKAHYFLWYCGATIVMPFLPVYAKQLGFSSVIVGLIFTILPLGAMIARLLMGVVADKYRCQKKIFLTNQLLTAAAFIAILQIPEIKYANKTHFKCDYNQSALNICFSNMTYVNNTPLLQLNEREQEYGIGVNSICGLDCSMTDKIWRTTNYHWNYGEQSGRSVGCKLHVSMDKAENFVKDCIIFNITNISPLNGPTMQLRYAIPDAAVVSLYQFWLFVVCIVLVLIGQAIVISVSDTICYQLLSDNPNKYGNQRCFGSLGAGLCVIAAGLIVDATSNNNGQTNYTYAFYLGFGLLIADFLVSFRLETEQNKLSESIFRDISKLLVNARVCVFILWCIFMGLCTGLNWSFLFWYIEEDLDGRHYRWITTLEGLVLAIQALGGELPLFFLSGWIIRKIGHINCMTFIPFVMGLRFILYSLLSDAWFILPIELLHGITFGLLYACMTSYVSIIAPPGTETTMQSLVNAVFEGIGASLGSFIGGYMFDEYSGFITYRIFGVASLILCVVHFAVQLFIRNADKGKEDDLLNGTP